MTWKTIKVSFRNKFLAGILALIPIAVTVYIIKLFIGFFDSMAAPAIEKALGYHFPGLGFVVSILVILLLGILVTNILGKRLFHFFENWLSYIPLVRTIYKTSKQILSAFSFSTTGFERVVFLEYPRRGIWSMGFVTGQTIGRDGTKFFNIFLPTTPNPTSGWILFMPEDEVVPSEMSVEEGLKTIISAGTVCREKMNFVQSDGR